MREQARDPARKREALIEVARAFTQDRVDCTDGHPFTDDEVVKEAKRAWELTETGHNWFDRRQRIVITSEEYHSIGADSVGQRACYLLVRLRSQHSARPEFILAATAMAKTLGWDTRSFLAVRARLVHANIINCVHPGGRGRNDPAVYAWGPGANPPRHMAKTV